MTVVYLHAQLVLSHHSYKISSIRCAEDLIVGRVFRMTIFRLAFVSARPVKGRDSMNVMKKSDIKIICGRIFSEHFRKLGISQKEFAAEIGVTPASVSQFLNGKRLPSSEHLCFICIKLRIEPRIQRYLFHLLEYQMPDEYGTSMGDDKTIRCYMDHCYDDDSKTLTNCKVELNIKSVVYEDSTHE